MEGNLLSYFIIFWGGEGSELVLMMINWDLVIGSYIMFLNFVFV